MHHPNVLWYDLDAVRASSHRQLQGTLGVVAVSEDPPTELETRAVAETGVRIGQPSTVEYPMPELGSLRDCSVTLLGSVTLIEHSHLLLAERLVVIQGSLAAPSEIGWRCTWCRVLCVSWFRFYLHETCRQSWRKITRLTLRPCLAQKSRWGIVWQLVDYY